MAQMITRQGVFFDKEILRSAAGLDDIKSMVLDSTKVAENPASSGRYVLEAGTVMAKITGGSTKIQPVHSNAAGGSGGSGAYVAGDIVGILATTIELGVGQGITASAKTDEPVAILHHGCDFNAAKLIGYTGNETIVKAALPTCIFR